MKSAHAMYQQKDPAPLRTFQVEDIAQIRSDETVIVDPVFDRTQDLFDQTLNLFEELGSPPDILDESNDSFGKTQRYVPIHDDLRSIYLFAEALGGYDQVLELESDFAPGHQLLKKCIAQVDSGAYDHEHFSALEAQQKKLQTGLKNANHYLKVKAGEELTPAELAELHKLLATANLQYQELTRILGIYKMHQLELAVQILYRFHEKIHTVQKSVNGIFLVDSEVLFIPTLDLIECVNIIFSAVGNPYLADNVDGVMLLAARNLLIEAVSFYSYYGKERIYNLVNHQGTVSNAVITHHIRKEIHTLFKACEADNKLVLKRIMQDAEKQFEISVEAIQMEAENTAVAAVREMIPKETKTEIPKPKKGLFSRMMSWFRGSNTSST